MGIIPPQSKFEAVDCILKEKVDSYLSEKCAKLVIQGADHPLHYGIRGIKTAMWLRVVKPELNRIAEERSHYIEMEVEDPEREWIEFRFVELPVDMPEGVRRQEPPLNDEELRAIRRILEKEKING